MTDKGMPEKMFVSQHGTVGDGFLPAYKSECPMTRAYIRADIVEELMIALEWYNDGRDPVVSEVMSRIKEIMAGK